MGMNPSLELRPGIYIHWEKYKKLGQPMPAAVVLGAPPSVTFTSAIKLPEDTDEFLNECDMIATVCGTIGFEGLVKSKKCLVFGQAWYKNIHGVLKINNSTDEKQINDFFHDQFDQTKFLNELKKLLSNCDKGVISSDYEFMVDNFDKNVNCSQIINNLNKFIEKKFEC